MPSLLKRSAPLPAQSGVALLHRECLEGLRAILQRHLLMALGFGRGAETALSKTKEREAIFSIQKRSYVQIVPRKKALPKPGQHTLAKPADFKGIF